MLALLVAVVTPILLYISMDWYHNTTDQYMIFKGLDICNFLFMAAGYVGFNANIIQFGIDQLHESPANHQSLLIHWHEDELPAGLDPGKTRYRGPFTTEEMEDINHSMVFLRSYLL